MTDTFKCWHSRREAFECWYSRREAYLYSPYQVPYNYIRDTALSACQMSKELSWNCCTSTVCNICYLSVDRKKRCKRTQREILYVATRRVYFSQF